MDDAVDGLFYIFDNESDEEDNDVASHNVQVDVIDGDVDISSKIGGKLYNCLNDISNVSRCCVQPGQLETLLRLSRAHKPANRRLKGPW